MSKTILESKLRIPTVRPHALQRPRLFERLSAGLLMGQKLTLVSAPAGFGKTTLAAAWVNSKNRPVAWLSLDDEQSDPTLFFTYLVSTLQKQIPIDLAEVLSALQAPQQPPMPAILAVMMNEIFAVDMPFILVLDDYHLVDSQEVDRGMAFLLDSMPAHMHLVMITREDPQLPLARMRARGQLTEMRVADLRFTPEEAAGFLNEVMGLDLDFEVIKALDRRTEGWIAGLQLAALSLHEGGDAETFIEAFSGSHRYILDYLVEEVLQQQPQQVQDFLLRTSILDRLCGSLCDAVLGDQSMLGQQTLEYLERANLLLLPLDDHRQWYRFHQLFADALQVRLRQQEMEILPILHQRASIWFENHGFLTAAIRHAMAGGDEARTAGLLELSWQKMDGRFQSARWLQWANTLPGALIDKRPVLSSNMAWANLNQGQFDAAERFLEGAQRWLEETNKLSSSEQLPAGMVVADLGAWQTLPASVAAAYAYLTQGRGDLNGTVQYGRRALELLPPEDVLRRGIAASILSLAYWANGDLSEADQTMERAIEDMIKAGNLLFALRGTYILADIRLVQGRLRKAVQTYEHYLHLAAQEGQLVQQGTADLHLRLSALYYEQNNTEAAERSVRRGEALAGSEQSPYWRYGLYLAKARMMAARGDLLEALRSLEDAERNYVPTPVPDLMPLPAMKARVWIALGRLEEARAWAEKVELSIEQPLSFANEYELITFARLLLGLFRREQQQSTIEQAIVLLERLKKSAAAGGRRGRVLEIMLLQALAQDAAGDRLLALTLLDETLTMAEPEGYYRIFAVEGGPMTELLTEARRRGMAPTYTSRLLGAAAVAQQQKRGPAVMQSAAGEFPLIEPLSERELEVLQLVAKGLSNRQISERLYLALSTVKGHNRNIYSKMQVSRRTEAVARARQLGLIDETETNI